MIPIEHFKTPISKEANKKQKEITFILSISKYLILLIAITKVEIITKIRFMILIISICSFAKVIIPIL